MEGNLRLPLHLGQWLNSTAIRGMYLQVKDGDGVMTMETGIGPKTEKRIVSVSVSESNYLFLAFILSHI